MSLELTHLNSFFKDKSFSPLEWQTFPVILRWMQTGRMIPELSIIDSKVGYLLENNHKRKVKEWLSTDRSLTQITAERYLLDHIRLKNLSFQESTGGNGVDAYFNDGGEKVGIEVTTTNEAIAEWIFHERLLMYLFSQKYAGTNTIEITYTINNLQNVNYSLDAIEIVGKQIIEQKFGEIGPFNLENVSRRGGYISWNEVSEPYNLFETLENRLISIFQDKADQLKKNKRNILFVGVNQLPINHINPDIFREFASPKRWALESGELETLAKATMPAHVIGVCFFVYTLNSILPMYPLRIIWKDTKSSVLINV